MKKFILGLILGISIFAQVCVASNIKNVSIVYPCSNAKINAPSTFIVGSVDPRCKLSINNENVMVYPSGSFVKVVPLKYGNNCFVLTTFLGESKKNTKYNIYRSTKNKSLAKYPMRILKNTITPANNLVYNESDSITVEFQGATGHYAFFKIKNQTIPMREVSKTESGINGLYRGFYKIAPNDKFKNAKITVFLDNGKTKISKTASGTITVIPKENFVLVRCLNDKTITRETPSNNGNRLSPLPRDTVLTINASEGDFYRVFLTKDKNIWVNKKDVELISNISSAPQSDLSDLDIYSDQNYIYLSLPMEYKLPVMIEHPSPNQLRIDIYGSNNNFSMDEFTDEDIKSLRIIEPQSRKLSLLLEMREKQIWGYDYFHSHDELILRLTKKPVINPSMPLKNICIALDAGHGGAEKGAVGPTGVCEKNINLEIVKNLKKELESAGAKVILTREDDATTNIYSRPEIARQNNALILLSIHCNALPDGQNPYEKCGCGTYYYQMQAKSLAESIQNALIDKMKLKDDGVNKGNFVLTRPTNPISVLVECAYMINPNEYEMLIDPNYQKEFAKAIKKGVEDFLIKQTAL